MCFKWIFTKEGLNCITEGKSDYAWGWCCTSGKYMHMSMVVSIYTWWCYQAWEKKVWFQFFYFILLLEKWSGIKWVLSWCTFHWVREEGVRALGQGGWANRGLKKNDRLKRKTRVGWKEAGGLMVFISETENKNDHPPICFHGNVCVCVCVLSYRVIFKRAFCSVQDGADSSR